MEKYLNVGCGKDYKKGWINLDFRTNNIKIDVQHNLNKFPYPFQDNTFDKVLMQMVLEHVEKPIKVLKEITRICKDKATITIIVPHAFSYANISNIQHKSNFTEHSFIKSQLIEHSLESELECVKTKFIFKNKWKKYVPFKRCLKIYLNGIYDDLYFELNVKKMEDL